LRFLTSCRLRRFSVPRRQGARRGPAATAPTRPTATGRSSPRSFPAQARRAASHPPAPRAAQRDALLTAGRLRPGGSCPRPYLPGRPSTATSAAAGCCTGGGSGSCGSCMLASGSARAVGHTERSDPRQPEREDHRQGGRTATTAPRSSTAASTPAGRHPRPICECRVTAADVGDRDGAMALLRCWTRPAVPPVAARLGRWRLPRPLPGLGPPAPRHHLPGGVPQRRRAQATLATARGRLRRSCRRSPSSRAAGCWSGPSPGWAVSTSPPLRGGHLSGHDPAAAAPPHPP
jgi:hypothetical protein